MALDDRRIAKFELNPKFFRANMACPNETVFLAGRASGKTFSLTAPWIKKMADEMPRSTGGLVGQSFTDLETKVMEGIFNGWAEMGLEMDIHYVFGKKPPTSWDRPLTPIVDHKPIVSFQNGSALQLISLHNKGSANGKSMQWLACPEAKLLNVHKLKEEILPALRGHVKHFGKSPWYRATLYESDKFSPDISWLLEKRKHHDENIINTIIYYQIKVNQLKIKRSTLSKSQQYVYTRQIEKLETILAGLRMNTTYFGEANAFDNIKNVGMAYLDGLKKTLNDYEYRIAILNEDPTRAENGFYPDRTERHLYNIEDDDDKSKPLGVAFDWQASITPLVSFQVNDKVVPGKVTLNFLHSLYVKHPFGPKDVINQFCTLHQFRECKRVLFYFDHTANARKAGYKTLWEDVVDGFKANGWQVDPIYMGGAPEHFDKYNSLKEFLSNDDGEHYATRIHTVNCAAMVLAMDMTGTKETEKGTKKDKSKEKDDNFPQEQATHFPDVFDQIQWAVNKLKLYKMQNNQESTVRFGGG